MWSLYGTDDCWHLYNWYFGCLVHHIYFHIKTTEFKLYSMYHNKALSILTAFTVFHSSVKYRLKVPILSSTFGIWHLKWASFIKLNHMIYLNHLIGSPKRFFQLIKRHFLGLHERERRKLWECVFDYCLSKKWAPVKLLKNVA